jgi:hypothetical protein
MARKKPKSNHDRNRDEFAAGCNDIGGPAKRRERVAAALEKINRKYGKALKKLAK